MTDPAVVIASLGEVDRAKNEAKDYADKIINELDINIQQAITEAVKTAVRDAWEEDNPPGTTRFFNQNLNPNERWPWSQWIYTGENKTIRVAKADGSNVGNTGGSDTVTLLRANLPAVQIDVTGETSEQEQQELTTSGNGRHRHRAGDGAPGIPGRTPPTERITRNIRDGTIPTMQKTISIASRSRRTNIRPAAKQPTLARENRSAWLKPTHY